MWRRCASIVRTLRIQLPGDLLVRVAERDQAQDLALALGQVVVGLAHHEPRRERRVHVDAVVEHRVDGVGELGVGGVLDDVALRAELEGLAGVGRLVLHREDDDACAELAQLGDRIEPGAVAQA